MALPDPISPSQVQRKAPVDDVLMGSIKADLDYLDSAITGANTEFVPFRWNGFYNDLFGYSDPYFQIPKVHGKMLGGPFIAKAQVLALHDCWIDSEGQRGGITFDVRKYKSLRQSISAWNPLWQINNRSEGATIPMRPAGANPNVTGTSVVTNGAVAVQSISLYKAPVTVTRIEQVAYIQHPNASALNPNSFLRLFLATPPDSDYQNGDFIILTGTGITTLPVSGAMDNAYQIAWISPDGQPCIEITLPNAGDFAYNSGDFTGIVGATIQLCALQIDLSNPADVFAFVPGEVAALNGTVAQDYNLYNVWLLNQGAANNVILKNLQMTEFGGQPQTFVTQSSAAGTLYSGRNVLTLDGPLDTTVTNVGDKFFVNGAGLVRGCWLVAAVNYLASPNVVVAGYAFVDGQPTGAIPTLLSQNPLSSVSYAVTSSKMVFDLSAAATDAGAAGVVAGDTVQFLTRPNSTITPVPAIENRYPVLAVNDGTYPTPNIVVDLGAFARVVSGGGAITYPISSGAAITTTKLALTTYTDISASLVAGKSRVLITSNSYLGIAIASANSGVGPPSGDFDVLGVNVGPGTPLNVVIDWQPLRATTPGEALVDIRDFASGIWNHAVCLITEETRSVFSTKPFVAKTQFSPLYNSDVGQNANQRCLSFNNGVFDSVEKTLADGDVLGFEVYNTPQFAPDPNPVPPGMDLASPVYPDTAITLGVAQDSEIAVGMRIG